MEKVSEQKRKELINIYWFMLIILAVVSLVNLLAIAQDSLKAAAIVNLVFLILIPIIFVLGYIDYRNYAPLSRYKDIAYCVTAVVALWITLIDFNVKNYTILSSYTEESTYLIAVSVLAALYFAVGGICLLLTVMNSHNRRRQAAYYYIIATFSALSSIFLIAFNYGTNVQIFEMPLRLIHIETPIVVDTGMTILALRVLVEYCMFLYGAVKEKRRKTLKKGEESEYRKPLVIMCAVAVAFMLINLLVLPLIKSAGEINYQYITQYAYAYEIIEFISVAVLLSLGAAIAFNLRKSKKYGQIYLRMGIASIIFASVYLIMDIFPITDIIVPKSTVQATIIYDVYSSIIQVLALMGYTLYVAFNKKLNATIKALDIEHAEQSSTENYTI